MMLRLYVPLRRDHEFVDRIDKSVQRVTGWDLRDAKQLPKERVCLSFPQTHVEFFFLHTFGC